MEKYLNERGFIAESGFIKVAILDSENIYLGCEDKYFSEGTRPIPMPLCISPPDDMKSEQNQVIRWDGEKYYLDYDFRGRTFYSKETGESIEIKELGKIPDNLTDKEKPDSYATWSDDFNNWWISPENGMKKQADQAAQKKADLLSLAEQRIVDLTEATDIDVFDEDEIDEYDVAMLKLWKRYRVAIKKVVTTDLIIDWPKLPE